jgi:hypothetical protein
MYLLLRLRRRILIRAYTCDEESMDVGESEHDPPKMTSVMNEWVGLQVSTRFTSED